MSIKKKATAAPNLKPLTNNSKLRMSILEKEIVAGIIKADKKKPGDFTSGEIVSVLTKLAYQYNDIGLQQQLRDYNEGTAEEGVVEMIPAGNA